MRGLIAAALLLMSAACASPSSTRPSQEVRGRALAVQFCSSCHAVGRTGASRAPEAPPFRTLSRNYRVDMLQEALAEGISVGHPAMPEFQFSPSDVDALIGYLETIQTAPTGADQ